MVLAFAHDEPIELFHVPVGVPKSVVCVILSVG